MNGLEGLPTKTLQLLWDNIHKQDGLTTGEWTDSDGKHCAIGSSLDMPVSNDSLNMSAKELVLYLRQASEQSDEGERFLRSIGMTEEAQGIIETENDDFCGTDQERRIHMLQFLGKELMSRNDIEVEFRQRLEAVV